MCCFASIKNTQLYPSVRNEWAPFSFPLFNYKWSGKEWNKCVNWIKEKGKDALISHIFILWVVVFYLCLCSLWFGYNVMEWKHEPNQRNKKGTTKHEWKEQKEKEKEKGARFTCPLFFYPLFFFSFIPLLHHKG